MYIEDGIENLKRIINIQLNSYWAEYEYSLIESCVDEAVEIIEEGMSQLSDECKYVRDESGEVFFSPYNTVEYGIFLYRLSNLVYKKGYEREATLVYYLNKIMHSYDWFYAIELPIYFWANHPVGSVLGRAKYGEYLYLNQGVTVGGNSFSGLTDIYPTLGNNVILCANATIVGDCSIGNNVIVSANTLIRKQDVPDDSLVFGESPNVIIKDINSTETPRNIWNNM
ncbi:MAG: hypothetical protein K5868_02275 [Lachnospiraceae bacterium]|nr:hypothetical protein [Lachnospiraceae bacterium]